jgi:hypothetical protein
MDSAHERLGVCGLRHQHLAPFDPGVVLGDGQDGRPSRLRRRGARREALRAQCGHPSGRGAGVSGADAMAHTFGFKWQQLDTFAGETAGRRSRDWLLKRCGDVAVAPWWPGVRRCSRGPRRRMWRCAFVPRSLRIAPETGQVRWC